MGIIKLQMTKTLYRNLCSLKHRLHAHNPCFNLYLKAWLSVPLYENNDLGNVFFSKMLIHHLFRCPVSKKFSEHERDQCLPIFGIVFKLTEVPFVVGHSPAGEDHCGEDGKS